MKRTAIYGGSFDPPHKGHLQVIRHLTSEFDRVIIVPAFISPFKNEGSEASAYQRLDMLEIMLKEADLNPEICDFEIERGGVSYTVDTLQHLAANETENDALYFVIGCEGVPSLHLWKGADVLRHSVTFYAIPRGDFKTEVREDFDIKIAPISVKDYSSTLFKAARAFDKGTDIVTPAVYDYILKNDLYNPYKYLTEGFSVFGMTEERIMHTYGAVKAGISLAKAHGEDMEKTIVALMLHDIGKYADDGILEKAKVVPSDTAGVPSDCRHAIIGADIASQYYNIDDVDIIRAIYYHTTGRPHMSKLEQITLLADYIEEGRSFKNSDKIRQTAFTDLDKATADTLSSVMEYLTASNKEIFDISRKALYFYKELVYNKN